MDSFNCKNKQIIKLKPSDYLVYLACIKNSIWFAISIRLIFPPLPKNIVKIFNINYTHKYTKRMFSQEKKKLY